MYQISFLSLFTIYQVIYFYYFYTQFKKNNLWFSFLYFFCLDKVGTIIDFISKKIFIGLSFLYRASFFNWGLNFCSIFFLPLSRSFFSRILFPIYSFNYLKMSSRLLCCSFASLLSVTDNVYFVLFLRLTTFAYVHIFLAWFNSKISCFS